MPRRKDRIPFRSTVHTHSRLDGKQDEMEREAKRERALFLDYPPLPMPAAVFPARRGWRRVGWVQPDCLCRVSETTAREREREGKMRPEWWVGLSSTLPGQCVCLYGWVHECARERGRMGKSERERQKMCVSASESTKTMPENRDWGTPCLKCRVPPPNITLTQRFAQSAQDLTIWRNNGCKKEQRERETHKKRTFKLACSKCFQKNPLQRCDFTGEEFWKCLYMYFFCIMLGETSAESKDTLLVCGEIPLLQDNIKLHLQCIQLP